MLLLLTATEQSQASQFKGLPDGIVDTDMLAADAVTADKVGHKGFVSYAIICDEKANDTDGGALLHLATGAPVT